MSKFDFQARLEDSISSVLYSVPYVARTIERAQQAYDAGNDSAASDALEDAAAMLDAAGEGWAADKVRYYMRFM